MIKQWLLFFAVLLPERALDAQAGPAAPAPIPVGTRARLHAAVMPLEGLSGRLLAQRHDTIIFRPDRGSSSYELPIPNIQRIELVVGRRRNTVAGLAVGTLLGIGLGGSFALGTDRDPEDLPRDAAIGGAVGLVMGTILGTLHRTEVWGRYEGPVRLTLPTRTELPPASTAPKR